MPSIRIYYGMFYIVSALALKYKFKTSKHQQLIGWFNKSFIKEGIIEQKYNIILRKAFDSRSEGDYGVFIEFSKEEVLNMFKEMKDFISTIEKFIKSEKHE